MRGSVHRVSINAPPAVSILNLKLLLGRSEAHLDLDLGENEVHIDGGEAAVEQLAVAAQLAELGAVHVIHRLHRSSPQTTDSRLCSNPHPHLGLPFWIGKDN